MATECMQRIGGQSRHREVRKHFHQAAVSQKIGNRHSKLVGDAGCVERRLCRPDARSEVEGEQHRLVVTTPAAQRMEIRQAILPADHGLAMIRSDDALRRLAASTTVGKRSA